MASWVVSLPLWKMCVRSSKLTVQCPPPKTCTVILLRSRSTPVMVPPTMVVVVRGMGAVSGVVAGGCAGAVFGTGVCGTPEPGLGVAGLFCAQLQRPNIMARKKSGALGERCIKLRGLQGQTFPKILVLKQ